MNMFSPRPSNIEQAIRQQVRLHSADHPGTSLIQICCVDHSAPEFATPHLHLQLMFTDRSRTPWVNVPACNTMDLHAAVTAMNQRNQRHGRAPPRVRLHLHEHESSAPRAGGKASESVLKALPRLKLSVASAAHLAADGCECAYCLESFEPSQTVLVMPCPGKHITHAACSEKWLARASTCPTCRFVLPQNPSPNELIQLMAPAEELKRTLLEAKEEEGLDPSLLCQEVDEEENEAKEEARVTPTKPQARAQAASDAAPAAAAAEGRPTQPAAAVHRRPPSPVVQRRLVRSGPMGLGPLVERPVTPPVWQRVRSWRRSILPSISRAR